MKFYLISVIDCVNPAGCYTSYKQKMRDTMKGQVEVMREDDEEAKDIKNNPNKDLLVDHITCFKKLVSDKKDLKENVSSLQTSLEEAIEQKEEAIEQKEDTERSYDELSEMFDELLSKKRKLDQETKQKRQQRNLSSASSNKNHIKQKEMNQAQDCTTNPVRVTTKGKSQSKTEDTMPPVGD